VKMKRGQEKLHSIGDRRKGYLCFDICSRFDMMLLSIAAALLTLVYFTESSSAAAQWTALLYIYDVRSLRRTLYSKFVLTMSRPDAANIETLLVEVQGSCRYDCPLSVSDASALAQLKNSSTMSSEGFFLASTSSTSPTASCCL